MMLHSIDWKFLLLSVLFFLQRYTHHHRTLTMCYLYTVKLFILANSLISLSVCSDSDVVWRYTNTQRHGGRTSTRDLLRLEAVTTASQDESLSDSDFVWSAPTCSLSTASGRVRLCFFIHLRSGMAAKVKWVDEIVWPQKSRF